MMKFSTLVDAMMEDVKHSEFCGFDVEVKLCYKQDEEGVLHAYVGGDPLVKFSVIKQGKEVKMQPYYFSGEIEEELGA